MFSALNCCFTTFGLMHEYIMCFLQSWNMKFESCVVHSLLLRVTRQNLICPLLALTFLVWSFAHNSFQLGGFPYLSEVVEIFLTGGGTLARFRD